MLVNVRKYLYFITLFAVIVLFTAVIYTAQSDEQSLPVFMYHSILKDTSRTGKYIVTPESFEADLRYLTQKGYQSVSAEEIVGYVNGENTLPEKPYLLTFDDGCYNNLTYVLPILEKYDAYAIISIVGSYCEKFSELDEANPAYSYLRWQDISELENSGRVTIGNHSYNFHSYDHKRMGAKIKKYEDESEYRKLFEADTMKTHHLLMEKCNINTNIYTYPYGAYCDISEAVLADNAYIMSFTCVEGINTLTQNSDSLRLLKRFNRHGLLATDEFFKKCKIY